MPNRTTVAIALLVLSSAGCTAGGPAPAPAPAAASGAPAAFEETAPPAAVPLDAYETLKTTTVFESTHLGPAGMPSRNADAFRELLASTDPKRTMRALYTEATLEGKLYALAGLYFVDPDGFEPAARALAKRGGEVRIHEGCTSWTGSVSGMIFTQGTRIVIPLGRTLGDYFAGHRGDAGTGDISGGYWPLRLAAEDDDHPAPREPLAL